MTGQKGFTRCCIRNSISVMNCLKPLNYKLLPTTFLDSPPPMAQKFFFVRVKIFLNLSLNLICWMWEGERIFRLKSIHFSSCCALPFPSAGSVIFKICCLALPSPWQQSACLGLMDVLSIPAFFVIICDWWKAATRLN